MIHSLCLCLLIAQPPKVETRTIVLSPADAPTPALRYPLLPEVRDLKTGNAALGYQRAHSPEWWTQNLREALSGKVDWFAGPLETFPKAEADKVLGNRGFYQEIDLAARKTSCEWDLLDRLRTDGAMMLLPDLQSFRLYGTLLGIRSRRLLLDHKYREADHSLQSAMALSRHVAEGPTLINFLVGASIANQNLGVVEDWIIQADSPNVYWSLTILPSPYLPMAKNLESEKLLTENMFPGAREALADPKKPLPDNAKFSKLLETMSLMESGFPKNILTEAWLTLRLQKEARDFLVARGRTEAQVKDLGAQGTVLLYLVGRFDDAFDDFAKYINLPYSQSLPALRKAETDMRAAQKKNPEANMLAGALLPAVYRVKFGQARVDRKIATLRSFEALRLYAAKNGGDLPKTWDNFTVVPVPLDPATGQPFDLRREGNVTVLTVPSLPGGTEPDYRYEITIAKK